MHGGCLSGTSRSLFGRCRARAREASGRAQHSLAVFNTPLAYLLCLACSLYYPITPLCSQDVPCRAATMSPRVTPQKRRPPAAPAPVSTDDDEEEEEDGLGQLGAAEGGPSDGVPAAVAPAEDTDVIIDAMRDMVSKVMDEKLAAALDKSGPLAELVRSVCREELAAYGERQPSPQASGSAIAKAVTASVVHVIKTTPQARSVYEMGREELDAAAKKSVSGFKKFRENLPDVLSRRITSIATDDGVPDDVLTIFFPAAARKNRTYSNAEFDKIVMSLLNTLYKLNWLQAKEERPFILQSKQLLDVNALDVLDVALLSLARTALHEGRSEARRLFFQLFAVFFMVPGASTQLEAPDAAVPVLGAGAGSAYFAVAQTIRASSTGVVSEEPPASVHTVTRPACLYGIASMILQGMVLKPHSFSTQVIHAAACNLRDIVVTTDPENDQGGASTWINELHKDAEKREGPGVWSLLLPMTDRRPALVLKVQTLTPSEKQEIRARERARTAAEGSAGSVGAATSADVTTMSPSQPSWL